MLVYISISRLYLRLRVESDAGRGDKGIQHFAMTDAAPQPPCVCVMLPREVVAVLYIRTEGEGGKGQRVPKLLDTHLPTYIS